VSKLPDPPSPAALRDRAPIDDHVRRVGPDTLLWRIHNTVGEHVLGWNQLRRFGPATGRFDPHPLSPGMADQQGVLYLAVQRVEVALAEVFQRARRVDVTAGQPWLTGLRLARSLDVLDLSVTWPTLAGASQTLCSGPRPRAGAWARCIAQAWPDLGGLWYPSSMLGGGYCVALWLPAADAVPTSPEISTPLSHPSLWGPLALACERIGYRIG